MNFDPQIAELISTVKDGIPVVAKQAVELRVFQETVFCIVIAIFGLIALGICLWSIHYWRLNTKNPSSSLALRLEGPVVFGMIVGGVFSVLSVIFIICSATTIHCIHAYPDYYAVLEVIKMAKTATGN